MYLENIIPRHMPMNSIFNDIIQKRGLLRETSKFLQQKSSKQSTCACTNYQRPIVTHSLAKEKDIHQQNNYW